MGTLLNDLRVAAKAAIFAGLLVLAAFLAVDAMPAHADPGGGGPGQTECEGSAIPPT